MDGFGCNFIQISSNSAKCILNKAHVFSKDLNDYLFFLFLGVEDAFSATSKVMTVSFHKYLTGFFPGKYNL